MIRIFVDSGSSIKQQEAAAYGVEILPLQLMIDGKTYADGVDLTDEIFYHALIDKKEFPKTSLPALGAVEARVQAVLDVGDEVLILTISSGISGTFGALTALFSDEPRVTVLDTKTAVGGVRLLVLAAKPYLSGPMDVLVEALNALIPRIRVIAIPETLEYLCRGGRLKKSAFVVGSVLQIKPLISLDSKDGTVKVIGKARGKHRAIEALAQALVTEQCDTDYPIVPSYTYTKSNLESLIAATDERYHAAMLSEFDHLTPAIACHWGPNAFGYIFIAKADA